MSVERVIPPPSGLSREFPSSSAAQNGEKTLIPQQQHLGGNIRLDVTLAVWQQGTSKMPFPGRVNLRPCIHRKLGNIPINRGSFSRHQRTQQNLEQCPHLRSSSFSFRRCFHLPSSLHYDIQASPATSKRHAIRARSYDEAGFHDEGRGAGPGPS